jgi:putative hydrolase of the HAD superfamily
LSAIDSDSDAEKFANDYMAHLAKASFLFPGVQKLVYDLSKEYRLIIVTNGLTRVQKYRIRESVIAHHFERIIISEEIGYAKPDPQIFIEGLKGIELPKKSEILMIGDSLTSDIPAGINFNIDTCWLNPNNKVNDTLYIPNYTISSLNSIYKILK